MPKVTKHIAALDIGTTEVRAVVGEMTENDQLEIIGIGRCAGSTRAASSP
jgi:cell division ATPase FtsA